MLAVFNVSHKLVSREVDNNGLRLASVSVALAPVGNPETENSAFVAPFTKSIQFVIKVELMKLSGTVMRTVGPWNRIAGDCAQTAVLARKQIKPMIFMYVFLLKPPSRRGD